jgi:hypothetical protein
MVSTPICYNVHWISKCLYYTKSFMLNKQTTIERFRHFLWYFFLSLSFI